MIIKKDGALVPLEYMELEGVQGTVQVQWFFSKKDEVPTFCMRCFHLGPTSYVPCHTHDWEHEIYVLEGFGYLLSKENDTKFAMKSGDLFYIAANELHGYKTDNNHELVFLCIIPRRGDTRFTDSSVEIKFNADDIDDDKDELWRQCP